VISESLAVMENVSENPPETNHKGKISVLQYYFKTVTKMEQRVVLHIATFKNS